MPGLEAPRVIRLESAEKTPFGPLSHYQALLGHGDMQGHTPIFTGMQTCQPGYQTAPHYHPYLETLFILEGTMEAWMIGQEHTVHTLKPGDTIALPPGQAHAFRNPGPGVLRLLGIHANPERIVHRLESP